MPAWRMCMSWTSSVHKPPKPQHFSKQTLLVLQNQRMHLLHYLGGDHELIFQRFLKKLYTFTGLERKYPCQWKENMVSCSGFQLLLKSKYEANRNFVAKLCLGVEEPNSIKIHKVEPHNIAYSFFPSASMYFRFLHPPQHFYANL